MKLFAQVRLFLRKTTFRELSILSSFLTKKIFMSQCATEEKEKRNCVFPFFLSFWLHQKCGAQFSFATTAIASRVLFCRFIPQSLMLTLPSYDPQRYKWKSLGLLVCTQNFLLGFYSPWPTAVFLHFTNFAKVIGNYRQKVFALTQSIFTCRIELQSFVKSGKTLKKSPCKTCIRKVTHNLTKRDRKLFLQLLFMQTSSISTLKHVSDVFF